MGKRKTEKNKKKLMPYLWHYWYLALLAPLFMLVEVGVDLLQPKLMSKIVDEGVLGGNMGLIISTGLSMLLLVVIGGMGGVASAGFSSAAAQNFSNDLRKDTFRKVMGFSFQQTDKFTTGSLVTRLTNDINATHDLVSMSLRMFVRTSVLFVGGIVMALSLNVNFGLILLVSLPVQFLLLWLMLSKASPLFSLVQKKLDKVNSVVQENVSGARVVKAYVREEYEISRFDQANGELRDTMLRVQKLMATLNPLLMVIMNVSVVAIIYIGGLQVQAQQMQVGQVMAAVTYVTQILMSIMMMGTMFQTVSRASASAKRIREVLETEAAVVGGTEKAQAMEQSLEFRHVNFHYPNASSRPVLHDINMTIYQGETVAILGATGCGKTSLVSLIPRFYDPTAGEILLDGKNIQKLTLHELRAQVGFVLQKSELYSGTIAENIRWGKDDATMEEVVAAAQIAQADDFIRGFEGGYDAVVGEKGASLSGGQKQRLAIARAVLKHPRLLIFDDSTSALDFSTEARLQAALRRELAGTTVIVIAQRVASVMGADRIFIIDNGTVAASGSHAELLAHSPIYQDIYYSQIRKEETADE